MADTIFDRILRKEIPAHIVYEDEYSLAFKDINAQAPHHVLVIPKTKWVKYSDLSKLNPTDVGQLFVSAAKVATKLGLDSDGYRIVVNCGKNGQQTVDYLHIHILGGRAMTWPPG